jgi:SH3 domain protein
LVRPATTGLLIALAAAWTFIGVDTAGAETAWVRGEVRLNVRTGPGTKFRIVGNLKTGDRVEIQQRAEDWIRVASEDGAVGWIPKGYLKSKPPAALLLAQLEKESGALREASATSTRQLADLEKSNAALTLQDDEQRLEIDQLRRENIRLKARARWPEWITGSAIVCAGMIVGAILQRSSGRRTSTRIRL